MYIWSTFGDVDFSHVGLRLVWLILHQPGVAGKDVKSSSSSSSLEAKSALIQVTRSRRASTIHSKDYYPAVPSLRAVLSAPAKWHLPDDTMAERRMRQTSSSKDEIKNKQETAKSALSKLYLRFSAR